MRKHQSNRTLLGAPGKTILAFLHSGRNEPSDIGKTKGKKETFPPVAILSSQARWSANDEVALDRDNSDDAYYE